MSKYLSIFTKYYLTFGKRMFCGATYGLCRVLLLGIFS